MPGQKTIENEDKAAMGSYRPESNFGTSDTVRGSPLPFGLFHVPVTVIVGHSRKQRMQADGAVS